MSTYRTPSNSPVKENTTKPSSQDKENFFVPETPALRRLGYGTGIGVFHLSPYEVGNKKSPWALKKVLREHQLNTDYGARITKEAAILKQLNHPNIVGFRGFTVTKNGQAVLAMEECSQSLGDLIEERYEAGAGSFPSDNIKIVARDIARALHYLHTEVKMIHGDMKSFNILINGNFKTVKLCDFGVSLKLNDEGMAEGKYIGTPCWSAPEALEQENITTKTDIFPFGITLWEMICLTPPHLDLPDDSQSEDDSEHDISLCEELLYGTRPPLPKMPLGDEYSIIIGLFHWCTEQSPQNRPTAKEILATVGEVNVKPVQLPQAQKCQN